MQSNARDVCLFQTIIVAFLFIKGLQFACFGCHHVIYAMLHLLANQ